MVHGAPRSIMVKSPVYASSCVGRYQYRTAKQDNLVSATAEGGRVFAGSLERNKMSSQYQYSPSPRARAPIAMATPAAHMISPAPPRGGHLKSCLRRGNYSRGLGLGYGHCSSSAAAVGPVRYSYAPSQQQQQQQQTLQHQYHERQRPQARDAEEEGSARSASAASAHPSILSAPSGRSSASNSGRSCASAPTATRSNLRGGSSDNSSQLANSVCNSSNSNRQGGGQKEREQQFMILSKILIAQHMTGKYSSPIAVRNLIYETMPQYEQRKTFHDSLQRNVSFLPMFPEPNEHPSLAMTRYVDKMFGPILVRELSQGGLQASRDDYSSGNNYAPATGSNSTQMTSSKPASSSPVGYGAQRYPQHWQQGNTISDRMVASSSQSSQPSSAKHHQPQHSARHLFDEPMFPVSPEPQSSSTTNQVSVKPTSYHNHSSAYSNTPPTPIPMQHLQEVRQQTNNNSFHMNESAHPTFRPAPGLSVQVSTPMAVQHELQGAAQRSQLPSVPEPTSLPPTSLKPPLAYEETISAPLATMAMADTPKVSNTANILASAEANVAPSDPQVPTKVTFSPSITQPSFSFTVSATADLSQNNEQMTQQPQHHVPHDAPLPQPISFASSAKLASHAHDVASTATRGNSLMVSSSDSSVEAYLEGQQLIGDHVVNDDDVSSMRSRISDINTITSVSTAPHVKQDYEKFDMKGMLPAVTPRDKILYHPHPAIPDSKSGGCCGGGPCNNPHQKIELQNRQPSYLQIYIKCERSEPFQNDNLDIVTWYHNKDKHVTADRTLVVRNTMNMLELIGGIIESFGLSSSSSPSNKNDQQENDVKKSEIESRDGSGSLSLECYKDVCFISDIKTTTSDKPAETNLTPMPIPGLYYKYIERNACSAESKKATFQGGHDGKSSSVLSTDPEGLKRTLVAQLLDKPLYQCSNNSLLGAPTGERSRLALVYCTPKRQACVSSRSTHTGVLPETIYHFQLLIEGIVDEDNLPSSFLSQTPIRCVGATGGVHGGSLLFAQQEVDELNRTLWKDYNEQRDVIGLVTPQGTKQENLEQIIDTLGTQLFDLHGNQTPKEFIVDRALYNIYSGKISMEVAKKSQHTMEAIEDTTEWLARRVEAFTKGLTDSAVTCDEKYIMPFENDQTLEEFDMAMERLGIGVSKTVFL